MGLAIVEAFYWGLPIITFKAKNGPESYYLEHGYNCFFENDKKSILNRILFLYSNTDVLKQMSINAKNTFSEKAKLQYMMEGFRKGIEYVFHK
jgi:glycosyltransferase involved in cell wall biosynthesis